MSQPTQPPSLLDRLRRFDPTVLPILIAGVVLIGAVVWLLGRPLPQPAGGPDPQTAQQLGALRTDLARVEALQGRVAALEGTAQRLAALEARPAPDLAPLREGLAAAAGRAEAAERRAEGAERQAAALEERIAATARELAARPVVDPNAFAPRAALEGLAPRSALEGLAPRSALEGLAPRSAVEGLAARLDGVARDIQAAETRTQQRITAAEQAVTGFAGRVAANETALGARTQAIEAQAGRLGQVEQQTAARLGALEQQMAARIAALEGQLAQRAQAIEQGAARIAALEGSTQRLSALEGRSARMGALDAVRGALEAGQPLGGPLGTLPNPPEALARFATAAPPTEAALRLSFEEAARAGRAASEPPAGTGVLDSAVSRLSGLVTVRRGEEMLWGDAAGAEIERARRALEAGDLEGALRHLQRLSPQAREAMRGWIGQAEALVAARAAIRQMAAG